MLVERQRRKKSEMAHILKQACMFYLRESPLADSNGAIYMRCDCRVLSLDGNSACCCASWHTSHDRAVACFVRGMLELCTPEAATHPQYATMSSVLVIRILSRV